MPAQVLKAEDVDWQPFWSYLEAQKVTVDPATAVYIERALGYVRFASLL